MASTKKLSNGTMGLRFMQNAKNLPKIHQDAEPAKVQNEAEWTVPGYRPSKRLAVDETISYENSYLPFLYPGYEHTEDAKSRPTTGRRVFRHGQERAGPNEEDLQDSGEADTNPAVDGDKSQLARSPQPAKQAKSALDSSTIRATRTPNSIDNAGRSSTSTGFLRPGGVDAPPTVNGRKLGSIAAPLTDKKVKREAEESSLSQSQHRKKPKIEN